MGLFRRRTKELNIYTIYGKINQSEPCFLEYAPGNTSQEAEEYAFYNMSIARRWRLVDLNAIQVNINGFRVIAIPTKLEKEAKR